MLYFAYGSNMSTPRLGSRLGMVRNVDVAELAGYRLAFHKVGADGSGKCDAFRTDRPDDAVIGVLYDMDADQKPVLDACEGCGYVARQVRLSLRSGARIAAFTYCAAHIDDGLKPFGWYMQHVLRGATEHGLPADYIRRIRAIEAMADFDLLRHAREMSIYR